MRLITVANREHPGLNLWRTSAQDHGFVPEVLGLYDARPLGHAHNAFGIKFIILAAHLRKMPADTLCLVTDGFDVVLAEDHDSLECRVRKQMTGKLLFCAEMYENPDQGMPWQENPLPYLNAGVYAGTAGDILACLEPFFQMSMLEQIETDDQRYWSHYYFEHPDIIQVDHKGYIFACVLDSEPYTAGVLHFQGFYKDLSRLSSSSLWAIAKSIHRPRTLTSSAGDRLTALGLLAFPVLATYPRIIPCVTGIVLALMLVRSVV